MRFQVNQELLVRTRAALTGREGLYWLVGGAGAGKTTVCQALTVQFGIPVYDMDSRIYGSYHGRFDRARHPVNTAWSTAPDALAWLLTMSWDEFNHFNQAALPEYLDLLSEDLATLPSGQKILIDGGICNPGLLAQVIPARRIVCLAASTNSSAAVWAATGARQGMKDAIDQLPNPAARWEMFLEFDRRISQTMLEECREHDIAICTRDGTMSASALAVRVASVWGLQ